MSIISELEYELINESKKAEREAEEESRFGVIEEADKTAYYRLGVNHALKILRELKAKYEVKADEPCVVGTTSEAETTSEAAGVSDISKVAPVQLKEAL